MSDQAFIVPLATWVDWVDWGIEMGAHPDFAAVVFAKYGVVCEYRRVYYFSNFNKVLSVFMVNKPHLPGKKACRPRCYTK